jgi:hypothetical protein
MNESKTMHPSDKQIEKSEFKVLLKNLAGKYYALIASVLFIFGIALRIYSISQTGALWSIIGEMGTFLAAVIAIPFIYDKFIKTEDRRLFLSDLEELLENKLTGKDGVSVRVYEEGRLTVPNKVAFFKDAQQEIIEIATAARSFANYFESRSYHEFRQPVEEILKRGVNFSVYVLDPNGINTSVYATDMHDPELVSKITRSLETLKKLRDELKSAKFPGKFEVFTYSQLPACYLLMIDPKLPQGRMHFSHYLNGLKRADTPVVEVYKSKNPLLFNKYFEYLTRLTKSSKRVLQ